MLIVCDGQGNEVAYDPTEDDRVVSYVVSRLADAAEERDFDAIVFWSKQAQDFGVAYDVRYDIVKTLLFG